MGPRGHFYLGTSLRIRDVWIFRGLTVCQRTPGFWGVRYAVHVISQFMVAPRSSHYATVLRILRYLKGTIFDGLHFSSHSSLTLQAYSDADWAGDPTDRRSTTGYCFLLGDSLIS